VGDPRFLGGGGGVDVTEDLDEVALGAIRPVDEGKNSNEQSKEGDQREKDLVRDRAG
jgi:hypothetical protein